MPDGAFENLSATVDGWLADFGAALSSGDTTAIAALFVEDSHWRDLVAFTWHIATTSGRADVASALADHAADVNPIGFEVHPTRTPPRRVTRAGTEVIEGIFRFETRDGPGVGVVRLLPDGEGAPKAWTVMTALDQIRGAEERIGDKRNRGETYSRDFSGPNWQDLRDIAVAYEDRDPEVLVVGGGQAGLSIAATLTHLGVDTLIVDKEKRIGDNWRKRYHALTLHNQVHVNHLPYMPFPPSWPTYIPKDKLAHWFEAYAESLELNFWTETEFDGAEWDADAERWTVTLRRAGGEPRTFRPRHIVMATGVSGIPNMPDIPTLDAFKGEVIHSAQYSTSDRFAGKKVLIMGTGTSAHDIAQDLHASGAHPTLIQRSSTLIINVEPSAQLPYALYDEGPSFEDCDLITTASPYALMKKSHQMMTAQARDIDTPTLEALGKLGFKMDFGEDDTGWQFKYMNQGGGYYFNVGCSDLIINGEVGLIQYDEIETFVENGARMKSGDVVEADLVVLATGYKGPEYMVGILLGEDVAERVGPIWGFDTEDQELRNMWVRTGQPGLWFIAGSFAQCRIYSKYLGLQIKGALDGRIALTRD